MDLSDTDKIIEILNAGGKIYLNPVDYEHFRNFALKNECVWLLSKLEAHPYIEVGSMFAIKPQTLEVLWPYERKLFDL